jgi:hypothetical protein
MTLMLKPRDGFDWKHVTWGKPDSQPTAICSYCSGGLPPVPLMLFTHDGHCAQFCDKCVKTWWTVEQ